MHQSALFSAIAACAILGDVTLFAEVTPSMWRQQNNVYIYLLGHFYASYRFIAPVRLLLPPTRICTVICRCGSPYNTICVGCGYVIKNQNKMTLQSTVASRGKSGWLHGILIGGRGNRQ